MMIHKEMIIIRARLLVMVTKWEFSSVFWSAPSHSPTIDGISGGSKSSRLGDIGKIPLLVHVLLKYISSLALYSHWTTTSHSWCIQFPLIVQQRFGKQFYGGDWSSNGPLSSIVYSYVRFPEGKWIQFYTREYVDRKTMKDIDQNVRECLDRLIDRHADRQVAVEGIYIYI